jgi:hypothetical protein
MFQQIVSSFGFSDAAFDNSEKNEVALMVAVMTTFNQISKSA